MYQISLIWFKNPSIDEDNLAKIYSLNLLYIYFAVFTYSKATCEQTHTTYKSDPVFV